MTYKVKYGSSVIEYSVTHSDRVTLAIEVYPDMSIKVVAPRKASLRIIREKVLKRARWIRKQQRYFEEFLPRTPKREYVSGESHYYLGKRYILRVRKAASMSVKLKGADLTVSVRNPQDVSLVKQVLAGWYFAHAQRRFQDSILSAVTHFRSYSLGMPQLVIRRMSRRWGSCTPSGRIILNPEIIKAPGKCIDYVVIHELCHLIHHNHGRAFYELQNKVIPGWEKWKLKLEKVLS